MPEILQGEEIELSKGEYRYPFPENTIVEEIQVDIESHEPPYRGAIDFLVPKGTPILAAREGTVVTVVDGYIKYGSTRKYEKYLNYITIQHDYECSQYCHLERGSARVKPGDWVEEGKMIGVEGFSGWTTEDHHVHFFVFRPSPEIPGEFTGLKPRFKGELKIKGTA